MPELEFLSYNLKNKRFEKNETQFNFACNCGLSVEEISLLENMKTDPKLSTIQKIAAYTDLTVSELLDVDQEGRGENHRKTLKHAE